MHPCAISLLPVVICLVFPLMLRAKLTVFVRVIPSVPPIATPTAASSTTTTVAVVARRPITVRVVVVTVATCVSTITSEYLIGGTVEAFVAERVAVARLLRGRAIVVPLALSGIVHPSGTLRDGRRAAIASCPLPSACLWGRNPAWGWRRNTALRGRRPRVGTGDERRWGVGRGAVALRVIVAAIVVVVPVVVVVIVTASSAAVVVVTSTTTTAVASATASTATVSAAASTVLITAYRRGLTFAKNWLRKLDTLEENGLVGVAGVHLWHFVVHSVVMLV